MDLQDELGDIPLLEDSEPVFEEWAAESTSGIKTIVEEDDEDADDDDIDDDDDDDDDEEDDDIDGADEVGEIRPKRRRKKGNPRPPTLATCKVCGVDLKHPSRIKEHMRTHTGEKPYECDQCGKKYSQPSPLINHYRAKHLNELPFQCRWCDKSFVNNSRRNEHELKHKGIKRTGPPRPHLKPTKKIIYSQVEGDLLMDSSLSMSAMANYDEPDLVAAYRDQSNLLLPPGPIQKPPLFPEEGETPELTEKMRESNARIDDVISTVLARVLAPCVEEIATIEHPEKIVNRRPYISNRATTCAQCTICGLFLKHPSKIAEHIRTHTGDKPFQCGECGLTLTKASSLRVHIRRMHTRERPFPCTWGCEQSFVTDSVRKEHEMAVHAGVKRYACIIKGCNAVFARRMYLMRHRKNVHPEIVTPVFDHNQVTAEEAADPVIEEKDMYYDERPVMMLSMEDIKMLEQFDEEEIVEQGGMDDVMMQL